MKKPKTSSRTQIRIKEVKDGVLVLPNNKYRVVLETSSINFELKSEEEQDAIIDSFQHFLNSLPSPVQVLIRIREVDIESYTQDFLKENVDQEKVYKDQLKNYAEFIKKLVSGNKIMSRKFYIIIPFKPETNKSDWEVIRGQLMLSADIISKGLERLGMKTRLLGNLEILELFYNTYNPSKTKIQPLDDKSFKALLNKNYAI